MSVLNLTIAPTTTNTLTVLGVTPAEIIVVGQDGKTQSFAIGAVAELDKATAGAVIELEPSTEGNATDYVIKSVGTPAAVAKSASTAGRAPKGDYVGEVQKPNI